MKRIIMKFIDNKVISSLLRPLDITQILFKYRTSRLNLAEIWFVAQNTDNP